MIVRAFNPARMAVGDKIVGVPVLKRGSRREIRFVLTGRDEVLLLKYNRWLWPHLMAAIAQLTLVPEQLQIERVENFTIKTGYTVKRYKLTVVDMPEGKL